VLKVALNDLPPGSNPLVPLAGDFDADSDVDGADFLQWQRGELVAEELNDWTANFGSVGGNAEVRHARLPADRAAPALRSSRLKTACGEGSFWKSMRGLDPALVDHFFSESDNGPTTTRFRRGLRR
jgi:hypothetical protein